MMYEFTDKMNEISGFGGGYEANCRAMVKDGLEWFDAHPNADPLFHGFKNMYGLVMEDNDEAKELSEAMIAATPDRDVTGAMHQAALSHVMAVRRLGWDAYVVEMEKR